MVHTQLRPSSFAPRSSRLHAHAVEHQPSTARARDFLYPLGGFVGVAIVDNFIRAERLRLLQLLLIHVGGDDAHGREHAQELNRHMSESADAHHDDRAFGVELWQGALDGVIWGQRGVAEGEAFADSNRREELTIGLRGPACTRPSLRRDRVRRRTSIGPGSRSSSPLNVGKRGSDRTPMVHRRPPHRPP